MARSGELAEGENSWNLLSSSAAYDGFVKIRRDRYLMGNGETADWDVVVARDSVAVIAITADLANVVLFEQFRVGPARVLQELPGGYLDDGESPVQAAQRELREETGFGATSFEPVGHEWADSNSTRRKHAVVAVGCAPTGEVAWDEVEMGRTVLMPLGEFVRHLVSGDLTDAGTATRALLAFSQAAGGSAAVEQARGLVRAELVESRTGRK